MKIQQVEELVGISKKNIRFYEEQRLLSPGRAENGYREYGREDVLRLKEIKLLRKLAVPIEDIRAVLKGEGSLEACLTRQLREFDRQRESLSAMEGSVSNGWRRRDRALWTYRSGTCTAKRPRARSWARPSSSP